MKAAIASIIALILVSEGATALTRSHAARAAFMRENPCPSTNKPRGPCPGYVVDHITPLCAGGADHSSNMQWQTVAEAKAKDRLEVAECRQHRRH